MGFENRQYYKDDNGGIPPVVFSMPKLTRLTIVLIATCLVVYLAQSFTRQSTGMFLERWFGLTIGDGLAFKQPWRWITYQYLHGDAGHFFFNMIGLFFFLPTLEMLWGWRKAFAFYTAGGVVAGIAYALLVLTMPSFVRQGWLIGASGSIFAAMGAVALLSPNRQIILLVFPVPIRIAVALFGAFFLLASLTNQDLSSAAHLGGLAFGFFAPYLAGPILNKKMRAWQKRRIQSVLASEQAEQRQIDAILAKVSAQGMQSLTWLEKRTLKKATEHQRKRDAELARRRR